jgi:hypothetical protein
MPWFYLQHCRDAQLDSFTGTLHVNINTLDPNYWPRYIILGTDERYGGNYYEYSILERTSRRQTLVQGRGMHGSTSASNRRRQEDA